MEIIYIVLFVFTLAIGVLVAIYIKAMNSASGNIFANSGAPINMANVLLHSIMATGQIIAGMAIFAAVVILMVNENISSEVGLPIISALMGYLVGRNFEGKIISK